MGSLIDLKNISEPVSKLIDAVKDATGAIYESTRIKRKARAEAEAGVIKAKGVARAKEIELRAKQRLINLDARRQINIETITKDATNYLPDLVSDEPVDEDWIYRFFDACKDVGDKTMQLIWSKLLAGEVAKPKSFTYRTLEVVRILHKEDAYLFTRYCGCVWNTSGRKHGILFPTIASDKALDKDSFLTRLHLSNLGLINMGVIYKYYPDELFIMQYFGREYELKRDTESSLPCDVLTDIGEALFPISGAQSNESYLKDVLDSLKSKNWIISELKKEK